MNKKIHNALQWAVFGVSLTSTLYAGDHGAGEPARPRPLASATSIQIDNYVVAFELGENILGEHKIYLKKSTPNAKGPGCSVTCVIPSETRVIEPAIDSYPEVTTEAKWECSKRGLRFLGAEGTAIYWPHSEKETARSSFVAYCGKPVNVSFNLDADTAGLLGDYPAQTSGAGAVGVGRFVCWGLDKTVDLPFYREKKASYFTQSENAYCQPLRASAKR